MADANATTPKCANCAKPKSDTGLDLKRCAKCHSTYYCSRDCQKVDWKQHKKVCASNAAAAAADTSTTPIDKPFHKLNSRTWLHDHQEKDVYRLLIDSYRLRMADDYNLGGEMDPSSIYGATPDGPQGLRRFLGLAKLNQGLLPPWWSEDKVAACEAMAMDKDGWSSVARKIEKQDVIKRYGDAEMPMQLRVLGEQVYGRGPAGQNAGPLIQMKMMAERGKMQSSTLDVSSAMRGA